jgi:FKBP-type peptidyl-prolyl cis-trans isomerase FklB
MGNSFRSSETALDIESLVAGLQDGLGGAEPRYDQATCGQALQQLQTRMRSKAMAEQQAVGSQNKQLGDAFLAKNKTEEGVQVTKSGLQYKVIKAGTGATPGADDTVRCNYRGTLIDGREFDASNGKPIEFPVLGVIPGWTEALQLMKVGAKWQLFIPAELAYGDQQRGPLITPGSTLVFDIELLGIVGK